MNFFKILIATTNQAKLAEFKKYFAELMPQLELLSLKDIRVNESPEETGATFGENALIKARFYAQKTKLVTLADDGGLEIDVLDGEPGVKSRRWPGHEASDEELVRMAMEKLSGVPAKKRGAQLHSVVVVVSGRGDVLAKGEAATRGIIPEKPAVLIEPGFPFRAILWLPQFKKFYQDLTREEHGLINHRREIVRKLVAQFEKGGDLKNG